MSEINCSSASQIFSKLTIYGESGRVPEGREAGTRAQLSGGV